jgi:hypothetical protein
MVEHYNSITHQSVEKVVVAGDCPCLIQRRIKKVVSELYHSSELESAFVWFAVTRGIPNSGNPRDLAQCDTQVMAYVKPYYGFNAANSARLCMSTYQEHPTPASINATKTGPGKI